MNIFLYIISVLAALVGFLLATVAKSSIHEIYSAVWFLIAAVLFGAAAIVTAVDSLKRSLCPRPIKQKFVTPGSSNPAQQKADSAKEFTMGNH